jgi:hypothetical protein
MHPSGEGSPLEFKQISPNRHGRDLEPLRELDNGHRTDVFEVLQYL